MCDGVTDEKEKEKSAKMKKMAIGWLSLFFSLLCVSCGPAEKTGGQANRDISPVLTYSHSMELSCARRFSVDHYEEGYALITIADDSRYLLVPEGMEEPKELAEDIIILRQPLGKIYLSASAVMDMFVAVDALDQVR